MITTVWGSTFQERVMGSSSTDVDEIEMCRKAKADLQIEIDLTVSTYETVGMPTEA